MAEYKIGRPLSDVRLRNWDTGRQNQLKLVVQRLESEVNKTLTASTQQSAKRLVTDQVPFVLNFSVAPGLKQVSIDFTPPPGLGGHPRRQLLFYEIQHAATINFADPTVLQTPQSQITLAGFGLGETRSFRARVVNTINEASTWSATQTVTLAKGEIQQTAIDDVTVRLTRDIGDWQPIFTKVYQPVAAKSCANIQVALACPHFDVEKSDAGGVRETFRGGPASVQLRWRVGRFNDVSLEFDSGLKGPRTLLSARPGESTEASDFNSVRTPMAFGTFMLPFFDGDAGVDTQITLEAAKTPGSEWFGPTRAGSLEVSDPLLYVRQGQIIEVIEDL